MAIAKTFGDLATALAPGTLLIATGCNDVGRKSAKPAAEFDNIIRFPASEKLINLVETYGVDHTGCRSKMNAFAIPPAGKSIFSK